MNNRGDTMNTNLVEGTIPGSETDVQVIPQLSAAPISITPAPIQTESV